MCNAGFKEENRYAVATLVYRFEYVNSQSQIVVYLKNLE